MLACEIGLYTSKGIYFTFINIIEKTITFSKEKVKTASCVHHGA